jgi:hypothetical protein
MSNFLPDWSPNISQTVLISKSHNQDGYETFDPPARVLVAHCQFLGNEGLKIIGIRLDPGSSASEIACFVQGVDDFSVE